VTDRHHDRPAHLEAVPPPPEDDYGTPTPTRTPRDLAERALLGAMLRTKTACDDATLTVTGRDLHDARYEQIWDAIVHLYSRGNPVDALTVADHLGNRLPSVGGHIILHELIQEGLAVTDAAYYADLVAKHAARDRLTAAAAKIHQDATSNADIDLDSLLAAARTELDTIQQAIPGVDQAGPTNTWAPVDFAAVLDGDLSAPVATVLARRDGKHLLYPYAVHSISGEPGSLKTWVALLAIAQELENGNNAALIDFEDRAQSVAARLLQIGVDPQVLRDPVRWRYVRPDAAIDATGTTHLDQAVADCTIAVIDGVTEAMSMHGWSINDNDDVAAYVMKLPRRIADRGPAVLQIDHVTKDSETRGRYAIGGQHKLASITGTAMKAIKVRSGGRGEHGVIKVVLDKDKHGDVGPDGHTIAEFHLDDTSEGQTFAWLDHPTTSTDEEGHFRPTVLMERVSTFLLATPGASSMAAIQRGVKGKAESIVDAVDALIREGHIRTEPGPRGATLHHLVTSFGGDS
jgi:hypothetical protein